MLRRRFFRAAAQEPQSADPVARLRLLCHGHDLLRAVSGHHGLAAWLFYLSAQIERTEGRRVGFSCPAALAAAVLAATAFLDRDFGPSRLLSALFALTAGATVYLSVFHMQTGAQRRGRDALMTGCAALQVLLYLVSNFTRDYTRFNLYYAVDLTLTLSMAALLPLTLREVGDR